MGELIDNPNEAPDASAADGAEMLPPDQTADWLDQLLLVDEPAYLDDHGFSARVIAALPQAQTASRAWLRPAILLGMTLLASVVAFLLLPVGPSLTYFFTFIAHLQSAPAIVFASMIVCVIGVGAGLLIARDETTS